MNDKHIIEFQSAVNTFSDQYQFMLKENCKLDEEITDLWSALLKTRNHSIIHNLVEQATGLDSSQLDSSLQKIDDIIKSKNYRVIFRYMCHLPMNTIDIVELNQADYKLQVILNKIIEVKTVDITLKSQIITDLINWLIYGYHTLWSDLLFDYLSVVDHNLFLTIIDLNSPDLLLDYLETLILFDCNEKVKKSLKFLAHSKLLSTKKFTTTQATRMIWISYYAGLDSNIYNLLSQTLSNEDIVELQAYNIIVKYKLDNAAAMNKSTLLMLNNSTLFMSEVKNKLWGDFYSIPNKLNEITISLSQEIEHKSVINPNFEKNIPLTQYPEAKLLYQIKPNNTQCTNCSSILVKDKPFKVLGYNKKKDKVETSVIHKLPYCPSCEKIYTYHNLTEELKKLLLGHHINVLLDPVDYKAKTKNVNTPTSNTRSSGTVTKSLTTKNDKVPEFLQRFITSTPTSTVNLSLTKKIPSQSATQIELNDETELKKLGYQITGLTRQQRWKILQTKAIPKIPLKTIVYTIANHIRLRKNQKNGETKFAYSISEWEHDLGRLKKEYYRSDFIWPKY